MDEVTVTAWGDEELIDDKEVLSWAGGWFNWNEKGHRWKDYLNRFKADAHPYLEAVRSEVLAKGLRITGERHQHEGLSPMFSDGKVLALSYRAWGDLMAAIWSEEENKDYSYMDFYM